MPVLRKSPGYTSFEFLSKFSTNRLMLNCCSLLAQFPHQFATVTNTEVVRIKAAFSPMPQECICLLLMNLHWALLSCMYEHFVYWICFVDTYTSISYLSSQSVLKLILISYHGHIYQAKPMQYLLITGAPFHPTTVSTGVKWCLV